MEENKGTKKEDFFIKYQADTAGKAAVEVLKLLGSTENLFILSDDPVEIDKNGQAYQKILGDIIKVFVDNNVGLTNYSYVWGGIKAIITAIEQHIGNHSTNLQKEISCRAVGIKNPLDGKWDINYANHQNLIEAVLKLRAEQGNVPGAEDYFTITPKEPDPIPSPIQREDIKN